MTSYSAEVIPEIFTMGPDHFIVDDPSDIMEDYGSKTNPMVQVSDVKADFISDKLFELISEEDVSDLSNYHPSFSSLKENDMEEYFNLVSSNAKPGRMKHDIFVPFPTSSRQSERDIIGDIGLAPEKYWPIASCMQSSTYEISRSELEQMEIPLPTFNKSYQEKGAFALGSIKWQYENYAKHMIQEDSVTCDLDFLYEISRQNSPLVDHEKNCIDLYKPICQYISNKVICAYTLFLRRLAEDIMHSSRKVSKNMVAVRTLGDGRIISLRNHSNLNSVESGPLCSFIIKMTQEDYDLYNSMMPLKVLFANTKGEKYVFVSWRSINLTDCSIMLKSNYSLLAFPLLFTDSLDIDYQGKVDSILNLLVGIVQCRNSEIFAILASFRYIMPGVLNKYHSISELILDKFPKAIRSPFTDYILYHLLEWLPKVKKSMRVIDRSKKFGNIQVKDEYDVEFHCKLPYVNFEATNFDQYLSMTYLVSMTVGKTKQSRHVQLNLATTLMEWEEKAKQWRDDPNNDDFDFSEKFVGFSSHFLTECVKLNNGGTEEYLTKFLRTKGTLDDTNTNCKRLFDRTLYEIDHPLHDCTVRSFLANKRIKPEMRMAVRDDHAGEREIFVTSLPAVAALNVIETVSHGVCEQLPSEHITLGGDRKVMVMQSEAQASLTVEENGWINCLGSEDASKWSTGDNPDILKIIWSHISQDVHAETREKLTDYFDSIKNRNVLFQDNYSDFLVKRVKSNSLNLTMGWPQGFFNKISSIKHYLCYCLALAMYKKVYDGKTVSRVKFAVHSDDSRHRVSYEVKKTTKYKPDLIYYPIFIQCLYWAKRKFLIRPNKRKSFYGGSVSEYLSNFQFHGSLFVPKSKFILSIFGDLTGAGYPTDIYSVMERIRATLKMNVGMSLGKFMMNYANHYVLRLYSMLPGMQNYDSLRVNRTRLVELGGIFSCHPIYLLFLGCKAHDILNYSENKQLVNKMMNVAEQIEEIDENSPSELYNHFLPIPVAHLADKGSIMPVRRRFNREILEPDEKWMALYINDIDINKATRVAKSLLYTNSMARAYSTAPEGLMYARIQQSWAKPLYRFSDKHLTFWEFVKKIESCNEVESDVYHDLLRSSPTLLALTRLERVENVFFGRVTRSHVISSQVNKINVISPGGNAYRYLKYALSRILDLDVVVPEKVDQKILESEIDVLRKELMVIPGVEEHRMKRDVQLIYKLLNVRNAKPSYLHLNKYLSDPGSIDMYELISIVLKNYSTSSVGKVSLGKLSSIYIGERTFRPENISFKRDRDDEIHTAAKVVSLGKCNVPPDKYQDFLKSVSISNKDLKTLVDLHPFKSNHVSYYLDYLFLCKELKKDIITEVEILEQDMDEDDLSKGIIVRSKSNVAHVLSHEIRLNDKLLVDEDFSIFIAVCYLRMYQLRLYDRNDWSDIEMPKQLIAVCPHLYFKFHTKNYSSPNLAFHEGRVVFKSGHYNKYLDDIVFKKFDHTILEFDGPVQNMSDRFQPEVEFEELFLSMYKGEGILDKSLGYGVRWEGLNTYSVGDLAKFNHHVSCDAFKIRDQDARSLFNSRYYATDDVILLKSGMSVPDVSRHKRYSPKINIGDLKKSDFHDLQMLFKYLSSGEGIAQDRTKKSLYYKEEVEPEKSVFAFFSRSRLHSAQFKDVLSYSCYSVLCQNLQPVRCKLDHEKTLRKMNKRIFDSYRPDVLNLRPSKHNLVEIVLLTSALIGIGSEVTGFDSSPLTGSEEIEFVKFNSYAGCTANVWHKIFSMYMEKDEIDTDDLED